MISVTILTKNSEETLQTTLESVQSFPEVLLLDTGSTDRTLEIARFFPNVAVHSADFSGFGPTHNLASSLAANEWILSLDSDEVLSPELVQEILHLNLNPTCVYLFSRYNYFNGKHIKWCSGWYPDSVIRLYHRKVTSFSQDEVHEKVLTEGLRKIQLSSPLYHVPYRTMDHFLDKMQIYTSLYAKQHQQKKKGSLARAILHSWWTFFKSYILKRGFLGGKEGFIISAYNAHTAYYKYLKLHFSQKDGHENIFE